MRTMINNVIFNSSNDVFDSFFKQILILHIFALNLVSCLQMCFVLCFLRLLMGFSRVVCCSLEAGAVNLPHLCFISYSPAAKDTWVFINADRECLSYLASSAASLSTPFSYHLSFKLFFCFHPPPSLLSATCY